MKFLRRVVCIVLSLVLVLQTLIGCSSKKTDETLYITKGEFFAYYVYDNSMTSSLYTPEEIQNCEDGSVEANIIVEWGYLPEELATKNLKAPIEKEIVVMVCANATFGLKEGNISDIKDADLLENPQLIANAYASGFFELENGYFDGAHHMSFAECEEIMNNAKAYVAGFHFEPNTEITETAEGVIEQDSSNYSDGDIIIKLPDDQSESSDTDVSIDSMAYYPSNHDIPQITFLGVNSSSSQIATPPKSGDAVDAISLNTNYLTPTSANSFSAIIRKGTFEKDLKNPQVGDTVIITRAQLALTDEHGNIDNSKLSYMYSEIMGVLVSKRAWGGTYECIFECPTFEEAIQNKNVIESNGSGFGIDTNRFYELEQEVDGWKLDFSYTDNSVKISAKKDFTVYETGRPLEYQNAKKTITSKVDFSIENFKIDVSNLKSFADKSGTGFIKITYDTDLSLDLGQSLRYTPDNNRNGEFPSNWNTSRWTDTDSKGAKEIKVARFSPSLYGVVGADIYIYLLIAVDGKVTFTTSIAEGGIEIKTNDGDISTTKLGTKTQEIKINVNAHLRLGADVKLKIFTLINVIRYDVGADADIYSVANLYYENKIGASGVYADEEGLNEYCADDKKFNYCIGIQADLSISGQLKSSAVKLLLDKCHAGNILDFKLLVWSGGFHFEDGDFVDKCSRGDDMADELEKAKHDDIELSLYKVVIEEGESAFVWLKAVPSETVDLLDTKNSITVKSDNSKVCNVTYNKANKLIIVDGIGEGSTEIVIKAKKGMWWWKKTFEQKISVTVTSVDSMLGMPCQNDEVYILMPFSKILIEDHCNELEYSNV